MAAFNGGILVRPDMTVVDERAVPANVAPAVIDVIRAQGLYAWIYRGTEWYVTDPNAPHAAREPGTVQFLPTVVPSYDGLLDRAVKIVGVSDDYDRVARCEAALHEQPGRRLGVPLPAVLRRRDEPGGEQRGRGRAAVAPSTRSRRSRSPRSATGRTTC